MEQEMEQKYPIIPFGEKILIKRRVRRTETEGGIILPESLTEQKVNEGTVLEHGTGGADSNGNEIVFKTNIGDNVLFDEYAGHEIIKNDMNYLLLPESSIVCILRD